MDRRVQSLRLVIGILVLLPMVALVPGRMPEEAHHSSLATQDGAHSVGPAPAQESGRVDFELAVLANKLASRGLGQQAGCHLHQEAALRVACLTALIDSPFAGTTDATREEIQFIPPVYGVITSNFGYRKPPIGKSKKAKWVMHEGIDIAAPKNAMFVAPRDGKIVAVEQKTGYGALLRIEHDAGYETLYAHVGQLFVKAGETVRTGQPLGFIGLTGKTTGPHVHFEMKKDGQLIDPRPFLDLPTEKELARKMASR